MHAFELRRGTNWLAPTAAVLAHLHDWIRADPDGSGRGVRFSLPAGHPGVRCAATRLGAAAVRAHTGCTFGSPTSSPCSAPSSPCSKHACFVPAVGWTGELHIDLYTGGFDPLRRGTSCVDRALEPAGRRAESPADARLPFAEFLHLLLGNRHIGELERTTPDCLLESDAGALLLDVLFPPMPLSTWEFC